MLRKFKLLGDMGLGETGGHAPPDNV